MHNLVGTHRCHLFELISDYVWEKIIAEHEVGIEPSEIGITRDVVALIRRNVNLNNNIGVWANEGHVEAKHGSDVDVFVEVSKGQFVWYALQAKILKLNKRYEVRSKHQWTKLQTLSKRTGCRSQYLLYNGVRDFTYAGPDQCRRQFTQEQFGCSLVESSVVAHYARHREPSFDDLHPQNAQPWRVIVCCRQNASSTLFTERQIKNSLDYYKQEIGSANLVQFADIEAITNAFQTDIINSSSNLIQRVPLYRIVIRTTRSLLKY